MKRFLLSIVLIWVTLTAEAQESFKFGDVTAADFAQSAYAVDTANADAIILD